MNRIPRSIQRALLLLLPCVAGLSAHAALILGTAESKSAESFDLTALGGTDWACWSTSANPAGGTPTNRKSGGVLVTGLYAVGGGSLRGSSSGTQPGITFTYTDGTSPASGSFVKPTGLFNTQLDTVGAGVGLSITLPTADTYLISVWGGAFGSVGVQGTFTASLPGATTYSDSSLTDNYDTTKNSMLYQLTVTPDNANDVLALSLVLGSQTASANEHVLINGVTLNVIPEPGTPVLLGLAGLAAVLRRRR